VRIPRVPIAVLAALVFLAPVCLHAQAALLLQDADGVAAALSPTGHEAIYFARICAASPTKLRRCEPGELGAVISRYHGIAGYDWLAMPLIPYLYSVESPSQIPAHLDRDSLQGLRVQYHDAHLASLGNVREGGALSRGWNQLAGAAYERRIYAFRFDTTEAQDEAFIAKMNDSANRTHFNILFNNCADFTSSVLNFYFPHVFARRIVPDVGIVTPREVAYQLTRYARRHPEMQLSVFEIPLVPGFHHSSRVGMSVDQSLVLTGYVIPIAILNPYVGAAIVADDLIFGRYPLRLRSAQILGPESMASLSNAASQASRAEAQNAVAAEGSRMSADTR
jgi:hypothetical protein